MSPLACSFPAVLKVSDVGAQLETCFWQLFDCALNFNKYLVNNLLSLARPLPMWPAIRLLPTEMPLNYDLVFW